MIRCGARPVAIRLTVCAARWVTPSAVPRRRRPGSSPRTRDDRAGPDRQLSPVGQQGCGSLARKLIQTTLMGTAQDVREDVGRDPVRRFVAPASIPGARRAVDCEMSRLAAAGEVVRVRKGLYWKGPKTRAGMPLPRPSEVALEIAGLGSGPSGLSAAQSLGLSTQVPAIEQVAVAGRVPAPIVGVRFVSRSIERRIAGLHPVEVALLEVLRAGPGVVEAPWSDVAGAARRLAESGAIRPELLAQQLARDYHVAARGRFDELGLDQAVRA